MRKNLKPKKCQFCKVEFQPRNGFQKACSPGCAISLVRRKEREEREREARQLKRKLNEGDRSWWLKKVQQRFNKWIRTRDWGLGCISCGIKGGLMQAGHYRSVGATRDALRFEPDNCHVQCAQCNGVKSGNLIPYRKNLIQKIGLERVEWLELDHKPARLRIDDLRRLDEKFKKLTDDLEAERDREKY